MLPGYGSGTPQYNNDFPKCSFCKLEISEHEDHGITSRHSFYQCTKTKTTGDLPCTKCNWNCCVLNPENKKPKAQWKPNEFEICTSPESKCDHKYKKKGYILCNAWGAVKSACENGGG